MIGKILFVDDEQNVLDAYQRSLRKEVHIETATSGPEGLEAVASHGPYAVIVTDMRMPGMDGIQFLANVKEKAPDSVRIMLTGNADQQTAMEAVNEGNIFRFLTKPCSPETMAKALRDGLQQYWLVVAEKELLEKTLSGSIQILTEVLSLVNPTAFGRALRVRRLAGQLAAALKIENPWQVEIAAMLSQIGCMTIPEATLLKAYRGHSLTAEELKIMQAHPQVGHDLINRIPRLEPVAEIIAYQEKLYNEVRTSDEKRFGQKIPLGARILKLALDFDKLLESSIGHSGALKEIHRRSNWYDPVAVEALEAIMADETHYELKSVKVHELIPNMILAEDIISIKGLLLIPNGQEVTQSLCLRLKNFYEGGAITESVKVIVPVKKAGNGSTALPKFDVSTIRS